MRQHGGASKSGETGQRPQLRGLVGGRAKRGLLDLDGMLRVSIGCSLRETMAWALLLSLWSVLIAFVASLTIGEYFSTLVLPCRVVGILGVVTGGFAGGGLIVLRSNSAQNGSNCKTSNLSSDW